MLKILKVYYSFTFVPFEVQERYQSYPSLVALFPLGDLLVFFVVVFAASPMSPLSSLGSAPGTTILAGRCDSDDWTARTWCVFFFWVWAWGMVGSHRKMFKMTLFVCIATTTKPGNKISECSARQDIDVKKTANLLRKAIGILKSGLLRRGGCS